MEQTLIDAMGERELDLIVVSDGEAILGPYFPLVRLVRTTELIEVSCLLPPSHLPSIAREHRRGE